jgi:hypothetical protein
MKLPRKLGIPTDNRSRTTVGSAVDQRPCDIEHRLRDHRSLIAHSARRSLGHAQH